jgi:hypothetical protein
MTETNDLSKDAEAAIPFDPAKEGLMDTITLVPVTEANSKGEYKNYFNLREFKMMASIVSIPPIWNNNIVAGKLVGGSSLLKIDENGEKIGSYDIQLINKPFTIHLNEFKQLASVSSTLKARDFNSALKDFLSLINPYLSILSWQYHVPLTLSNVNGIDIENQYQFSKFIQPFAQKSMQIIINDKEFFDDRLAALYAFQREMLNSTSGSYRLLCIYKCIVIVNVIKNDLRKKAIKKQLDLKNFKDLTEVKIESTELNLHVWPEAIGWKLGRLVSDKVRPMRNKIAHEFDDNASFANPDMGIFGEQIRDYADALIPLMRIDFEKTLSYHDKYLR